MKCLITGGCGFIGSKLAEKLASSNRVDVYDIEPRNFINGVNYKRSPEQISYTSYDVIFHLAAISSIRASFKDPIKTLDVNVVETIKLLEQLKNSETKLVFGSSCTVHCKQHSPYSLSKKVCEEYCKIYQELFGVNVSIARIGNAFGETDPKGVINKLVNQKKNNQPLSITGSGCQTRDFIHVDDIVSGLIFVSWLSGTFELCTGNVYSLNEIANILGGPKEYIELPPCEGFLAPQIKPNIPNWKAEVCIKEYLKKSI